MSPTEATYPDILSLFDFVSFYVLLELVHGHLPNMSTHDEIAAFLSKVYQVLIAIGFISAQT